MLLLTLLITSMAGCCKGSDSIVVDANSVTINGDIAKVSQYTGYDAVYNDGIYNISYNNCVEEIRECPSNRQGVHEDDMSEYKKCKYFDAFQSTYRVIHMPTNDGITPHAEISTGDKETHPIEPIMEEVYNTLKNMTFDTLTNATYVSGENKVRVHAEEGGIVVRPGQIVISGILAVGTGTKDVSQQIDVGDVTVKYYESESYKYYQYGDILIKMAKAYDIEQYITLE